MAGAEQEALGLVSGQPASTLQFVALEPLLHGVERLLIDDGRRDTRG
jgi:hypothetical protein